MPCKIFQLVHYSDVDNLDFIHRIGYLIIKNKLKHFLYIYTLHW